MEEGQNMNVKIQFLSEPSVQADVGFMFVTTNDSVVLINNEALMIPKGFKTDLASIPRILWSIFPPQKSEFVTPSILHDYMYTIRYKNDRALADEVFYEAIKLKGASTITSLLMWSSLRLFGESHYG